jgi:integrase
MGRRERCDEGDTRAPVDKALQKIRCSICESLSLLFVVPWSVIPELRARIEAAKFRHQQLPVRSTTFFVDDIGQRPWSSNRFFAAFSRLRSELARRHESFPTKYAVKHYSADPMRIPTAWLTMRTLRHTCITALHDAGRVREQIRAITGHTIASINEVLDRYTKLTADQAGAALKRRLAHEKGPCESSSIAPQASTKRERNVSRNGQNVSREHF